ncbi:hypothetical protein F2Q70_00030209 [Brassica cretica]|uniref:Uncharacterized protein n=1 Tax=Brassica cretica TaxID=69181 RepID=A0A8S9FHI0_BRACR|nr:hypothetical protein F2Q70_00030209 [Brassica cretica]
MCTPSSTGKKIILHDRSFGCYVTFFVSTLLDDSTLPLLLSNKSFQLIPPQVLDEATYRYMHRSDMPLAYQAIPPSWIISHWFRPALGYQWYISSTRLVCAVMAQSFLQCQISDQRQIFRTPSGSV